MCGAASSATPARPSPSPAQRSGPSRSVSPATRPASTAMMGTAATSSPVSELSSTRSASESNAHGPMISTRANTSSARQCARTTVTAAGPRGQRQQHERAERGAREHQHRHRDLGHRHLDQQVRDAPQHAHRREQDPSTSAHRPPSLYLPAAACSASSADLHPPGSVSASRGRCVDDSLASSLMSRRGAPRRTRRPCGARRARWPRGTRRGSAAAAQRGPSARACA